MLLDLKHKQLDVYKEVSVFVKEAYLITLSLPAEEKFNMVSQIRRAALSVKLNLAEECSRKSLMERKRFFEISRSSLIEVDAAFEVAIDLEYIEINQLEKLNHSLHKRFAMLTNMIKQEEHG